MHKACSPLILCLCRLCHQVERDAYKVERDAYKVERDAYKVERDAFKAECDALKRSHKAECDALKRKCEELSWQDLERVMLHARCMQDACKGPFGKAKGPMPDDVDDIGHEDKKAKSELKLKQDNDVILIFKQHPVPDQEHLSDELEPLDLGQLDRQLDLGDMSSWSIPKGLVTRTKAASDADTAQQDASLVQ